MEQSQFALVYKDEEKAWAGLRTLKRLHMLGHIKLKRAIVTVCQKDGQLIAEEESQLKLINPKYGLAGIAGTITGLIGTAPSGPGAFLAGAFWGAVGTTAAISYDAKKQRDVRGNLYEEVESILTPNSSALVIQVEILHPSPAIKALAQIGEAELIQDSTTIADLFQEQLSAALKKTQSLTPKPEPIPVPVPVPTTVNRISLKR
jgi:uncharacterized membrane protein